MKNYLKILSLLLLIFQNTGCFKPDEFSKIPHISNAKISKTAVQEGAEAYQISVDFEDGDGDIGSNETDSPTNFFVIDKRANFTATTPYKVPYLSPQGDPQGISGTITISVQAEYCLDANGIPCYISNNCSATDTAYYQIYIADRAGNKSNTIQAPPLVLFCQ